MGKFLFTPWSRRNTLVLSASVAVLTFVSLGQAKADDADSTEPKEVVVVGKRLTTQIMEKRKSDAETVTLSQEEIQSRPVSNVVDAVSILPGVSAFADNGRGQAATGELEYVTINGIASNYNAYELNGVRVPSADPGTRALSLKLLPPFGIQSISVNKTPDASVDGDSIGGVLDIRTPSAFDYDGDLTRVTVQGSYQQLAKDAGFNSGGHAVQAELARRFLGGRLGVYATLFQKEESTISEAGEVASYAAQYYGDSGKPLSSIALAPTQYKWDLQQNKITTTGGALGLDFKLNANTTLYLRGTAVSYKDHSSDSQVNIRSGGSAYTVQNPDGTYSASTAANAVLTLTNPFEGHYFQLRDQIDALDTVQFGGKTAFDRLHLSYEGYYGHASQTAPNYVEGSLYGMPQAGGADRISLDQYRPTYTFGAMSGSGLTAAQVEAAVLNQKNNAIWKYQGQDIGSKAQTIGIKLDGDYALDAGVLKSLQFGVNLNSSTREVWDHYFVHDNDNIYVLTPDGSAANWNNPQGPTTDNVAGRNVPSFLNFPGQSGLNAFRAFSRGAFVTPAMAVKYSDMECKPDVADDRTCPGPYTLNDYNAGAATSMENIYAAYLMGHVDFGRLEMIPGVRYEQTNFHGKSWLDITDTTGKYVPVDHKYGELLPSLNAIYRTDNDLVFRASVRKGFSRPAFSLLIPNGGYSVVEPSGGIAGQVVLNLGNPDLKPTRSTNYDASVEYYGVKDSVFEAALYHKDITNFIYTASQSGGSASSNGTSTSTTIPAGITVPNGYTVMVNEPANGARGFIDGISLNAQQRLNVLTGLASGFGYSANVTFQHSKSTLGGALPQSPDWMYNVQLTYDRNRIHGALTYQYTGLQLVNFGNGNDGNQSQYLQPTKFLNLSIGYRLGKVDIVLQGKNILNNPTFWKTVGKSTQYLGVQDGGGNGSYIKFGPTYSLTATYSF